VVSGSLEIARSTCVRGQNAGALSVSPPRLREQRVSQHVAVDPLRAAVSPRCEGRATRVAHATPRNLVAQIAPAMGTPMLPTPNGRLPIKRPLDADWTSSERSTHSTVRRPHATVSSRRSTVWSTTPSPASKPPCVWTETASLHDRTPSPCSRTACVRGTPPSVRRTRVSDRVTTAYCRVTPERDHPSASNRERRTASRKLGNARCKLRKASRKQSEDDCEPTSAIYELCEKRGERMKACARVQELR